MKTLLLSVVLARGSHRAFSWVGPGGGRRLKHVPVTLQL